jgi:hypothetical protein
VFDLKLNFLSIVLPKPLFFEFFIDIRVVNFDSDGKSDQKIDIFSANQISAFLQQLTPPFRRFFRQKIRSTVTSIDISLCPWRGHGEGCVTCHLS